MSLPKPILNYMKGRYSNYTTVKHPATTTALACARKVNCGATQMAKTIVVEVDNQNSMFVLPAGDRIHMATLKDVIGAKSIHMLTEDELSKAFPDCETGAQPPFGELYKMPVYISPHFGSLENIFFEGGTHTEALKVSFDEYLNNEHPKLADFSVPNAEYKDYRVDYY